jgi:hypothetical protein
MLNNLIVQFRGEQFSCTSLKHVLSNKLEFDGAGILLMLKNPIIQLEGNNCPLHLLA